MSTAFVGRARNLAELSDIIGASAAGRGSLTLVCGEPGIGKTALVEEAARAAVDRGVEVRWASCWEGDGQPPYWPWLQVVRAERAGHDDAAADTDGVAELLAVGSRPGDVESARFELFEALARLLLKASADGPRLVVVDDVHWADASSLQFLLFFARQLRDARIAVVATCRDVDVDPRSPVLEVFPELCRVSRVVSLGGLDDEELTGLLSAGGVDPGVDVVSEVARQSGGNPLFASELARLGLGSWHGTAAVPRSLREIIGRRLDRFERPTLHVLEAASVLGRDVDLGELAVLLGLTEAEVLDGLAGPVTARLLVRGAGDDRHAVSFAHDLVRRTLYDRMSTTRRAELHRRAADTLASIGPGAAGQASRIAAHRVEAAVLGDRPGAVSACRAAAEEARHALAHDEAAGFLRTAVRLADDDPELGSLLVELAEAEWRAGRQDAAIDAARRAVDAARATGDATVFARAALACCFGSAIFVPRPDLVGLLEEAIDRLGDDHPALTARVLARQSWELMTVRPADHGAVARRAVEVARAAGDDLALGEALLARHQALWRPAMLAERAAIADELAAIATRTGNRDQAMESALMRLVVALERGDGAGVDAALTDVTTIADALRRPLWRFYAASRTAGVAVARGRHDDAERALDEAADVAPAGLAEAGVVLDGIRLSLAMERGDDLSPFIEAMAAFYERSPRAWGVGTAATLAMTVSGRLAQAATYIDRLLSQLSARDEFPFSWLAGAMGLAEACMALEMTDALADLYEVLLPYEDLVGVIAGYAPVMPVAVVLSRLAAARGFPAAAAGHAEAGMRTARRMRSRAWEAEANAASATALAAQGDAAGAEHVREQARAVAEELGLARVLTHLGRPSTGTARAAPPAPARLAREGDQWRVSLGGETSVLRDAKGLHYLAELVAHPGVERHALDLVALTEGASTEPGLDRRRLGHAGALLDPAAKEAYRRRLEDLRDDVAEAEAFHDEGRAARAQSEIDALVQELSRAVGLGGRDRMAASAAERARLNVTRALRTAIARIEAAVPPLGAHLDRCTHTGLFCSYEPDGRLRVVAGVGPAGASDG